MSVNSAFSETAPGHYAEREPVTFAAIYGGLGAGVLALLLSTLLAAVWIEPLGSPVAFRPADLVALALFLAAGGVIVWVCHRVRRAQRQVRAASAAQARLAAVVGLRHPA